jgi:hypothetical protein
MHKFIHTLDIHKLSDFGSSMKEKDLCIAIGLSREMFKEIRDLYEQGVHWNKIPTNRPEQLWEVNWTEEGIKLLKKNLGFNEPEQVALPERKKGKVVRKYTNPRIIGVVLDDEPEKEHNVLCRESNKFNVNMPVEVRWDGARWCIVRHPRFNGKY